MAKSLLFRWRKEAGLSAKRRSIAPFVPVRIAASSASAMSMPPSTAPQASTSATQVAGTIEIELAGGHKLKVHSPIDVQALKNVIAALRV